MQIEDARFDYMQAAIHVCEQFSVTSVDALGLGSENAAVCAIGGLLSYLKETQKTDISHINALNFYTDGLYMELDIQTVRNLELVSTIRTSDKKGSLLWAIDKTKTAMGSRLMRAWLSRPLLSPLPIKRRQAAVCELPAPRRYKRGWPLPGAPGHRWWICCRFRRLNSRKPICRCIPH